MKKLKWLLDNIPEMIAGFCLVAAVVLTTLNALSRYAIGYTVPGMDNLVALLFAWCLFMGAVVGYKRGKHFGVDFVVMKFPEGTRKTLQFLIKAVEIAALGALLYLAWELTANVGDRRMVALQISYIYMDIAFLLGIFLIFVYSVIDFVKLLKALGNHGSKKTQDQLANDGIGGE